MIYCFCFHTTLKAPVPLHFYVYLTVCRGPNREGGDPAERRVLPKNPQPCQRGGQTDGEPAGERRTIHHSAHCYKASKHQTRFETSGGLSHSDNLSACLPSPHLLFQTLKDYQRRLDTSGLKPSNELYTEYKVSQQTCRWHPH